MIDGRGSRRLRLNSAEAEWAARRCECGADDACAFARERDAAKAELDLARSLHDVAVRQRDAANFLLEQVTKERDEARSKYQWMVDRACNERLDGYRELGARAANAENERDSLLNRVDSLTRALRGLLLSRDASWIGGHDWQEAVDDACKALGIEPGEDA